MTITPTRTDSSGFTLIELMIVIVIAAILLAVAVPSFQDLIRRNTVESMQAKVTSAISTARTEAASRNTVVSVCASADGASCVTTDDWTGGWIVFEDGDRNGVFNAADEEPIDAFEYQGRYSITVLGPSKAINNFSFTPQGFLMNASEPAHVLTNVLIRVCEPEGDARYVRGLYVNASGLVMKTRDGNSDGIHDNPRLVGNATNANLNCN